MRIRILRSSEASRDRFWMTSFVVDSAICIDPGGLTVGLPAAALKRIRHILISHPHFDHIGTLPLFLEHRFAQPRPLTLHCSAAGHRILSRCLFNDRVWPRLFLENGLRRATLRHRIPFRIGGLRITPVRVRHPGSAFGFTLETRSAAVALSGDTGSTHALWALARRHRRLRAAFIEASFPDELQRLARVSDHLTPSDLLEVRRALGPEVWLYVVHVKAAHHRRIADQLRGLGDPRIRLAQPGRVYTFR